jgi:hypothetical protein
MDQPADVVRKRKNPAQNLTLSGQYFFHALSVRSLRASKEFYQRFQFLHQRLGEKAATLESFRG